jgi:hypothetical protein
MPTLSISLTNNDRPLFKEQLSTWLQEKERKPDNIQNFIPEYAFNKIQLKFCNFIKTFIKETTLNMALNSTKSTEKEN